MKLYKISQTVVTGWDTYSDAVVAAESEDEARCIHPSSGYIYKDDIWCHLNSGEKAMSANWEWSLPKDVQVECIGQAESHIESGVIVASYHAG